MSACREHRQCPRRRSGARGALPVTGSRVLWSIGTKIYRLCLLGAAAVRRFSAATDAEALLVARVLVNGRPPLSDFELWEGRRKVGGETRRGERKK